MNGNPAAGVQGSIPPAASIEFPQREIVNLITKTGQTATNSDLTQLARGIQSGVLICSADTGTADALAINLPNAPAAYPDLFVVQKSNAANATTTPTISNPGLPTATIVRRDGSALLAGDLPAHGYLLLSWDGTHVRNVGVSISDITRGLPVQAITALSATNSIPTGNSVSTKITNYGTVTNNITDAVSWGSSEITVLKTGTYFLSCVLDTNMPIGSSDYGCTFGWYYVSGPDWNSDGLNSIVAATLISIPDASADGMTATCARMMRLTAGDVIALGALQTAGGNENMPIAFSLQYMGD